MQSTSQVQYRIWVYPNAGGDSFLNFTLGDQFTDEQFVSLVQIIRDFPWPASMNGIDIMAAKDVINDDNYQVNTATTPPTIH
jgi:hypothetical protein